MPTGEYKSVGLRTPVYEKLVRLRTVLEYQEGKEFTLSDTVARAVDNMYAEGHVSG